MQLLTDMLTHHMPVDSRVHAHNLVPSCMHAYTHARTNSAHAHKCIISKCTVRGGSRQNKRRQCDVPPPRNMSKLISPLTPLLKSATTSVIAASATVICSKPRPRHRYHRLLSLSASRQRAEAQGFACIGRERSYRQ